MNIPVNRQVKNNGDLQNVITSAILQQQVDEFTAEDIYLKVEENIKFSTFGKYGKGRKEVDVKKKIDDTIDEFVRLCCIKRTSKGKLKRVFLLL